MLSLVNTINTMIDQLSHTCCWGKDRDSQSLERPIRKEIGYIQGYYLQEITYSMFLFNFNFFDPGFTQFSAILSYGRQLYSLIIWRNWFFEVWDAGYNYMVFMANSVCWFFYAVVLIDLFYFSGHLWMVSLEWRSWRWRVALWTDRRGTDCCWHATYDSPLTSSDHRY